MAMAKVNACDVPEGSLLAEFGGPDDYRDCFACAVPGEVTLAAFIERFYCSMAFRPERLALGLIGRGASNADAAKLARGEAQTFAAWNVVDRWETDAQGLVAEHGPAGSARASRVGGARPQTRKGRGDRTPDGVQTTKNPQILLRDFSGATASWLSVQPGTNSGTVLLFGSWVGKPDSGVVKALMPVHQWYARVLLGGV